MSLIGRFAPTAGENTRGKAMSATFFTPALAIVGRFTLTASHFIASVLFSASLACSLAMLARQASMPRAPAAPDASALSALAGALQAQPATTALMLLFLLAAVYYQGAIRIWTRARIAGLREAVERVANGELSGATQSYQGSKNAESLRVSQALGRMNRNLSEIVNQVRESADKILHGAKEIAAGNANLSRRTEEEATTLTQTATGIEELGATVKQNADNCRRADALAAEANKIAGEASECMRLVVQTMSQIEVSSRQVTDIVGVIEGIAFQTNILALNAAVEAARAGDQGRGFAVVASEVRGLAQRSADAAKKIKELIETSAGDVAQGATLVDEAGGTMDKVLGGVRQVNELISQIAVASSEQSTGVEQITRAIARLENVTQQNAALVDQATATGLAFEDEAARLVDIVGAFKTDRMEDRDRAVALVKKAVAHLRERGLQQACRDFNDPNGGFVQGELYIFGNDAGGILICNGRSPELCGRSSIDKTDANGKPFVRDMIELAMTKGKGWYDYQQANPITGKLGVKSAYVERIGDVMLGCGIYKEDAGASVATARPSLPRRPASLPRGIEHKQA
jgi:methyl-accepting chemotaxis protein